MGGLKGWEPIASAPKDGTLLLLCVPGRSIDVGQWFVSKPGWWIIHAMAVAPTHWQPLPEAPSHEDQSAKSACPSCGCVLAESSNLRGNLDAEIKHHRYTREELKAAWAEVSRLTEGLKEAQDEVNEVEQKLAGSQGEVSRLDEELRKARSCARGPKVCDMDIARLEEELREERATLSEIRAAAERDVDALSSQLSLAKKLADKIRSIEPGIGLHPATRIEVRALLSDFFAATKDAWMSVAESREKQLSIAKKLAEKAGEWAAGYPLGGGMDAEAASEVYLHATAFLEATKDA